jgi:hypothetical protein
MDTEGTLFLPKEGILESFVPCEIPRYACYNFIFYLFKREWCWYEQVVPKLSSSVVSLSFTRIIETWHGKPSNKFETIVFLGVL